MIAEPVPVGRESLFGARERFRQGDRCDEAAAADVAGHVILLIASRCCSGRNCQLANMQLARASARHRAEDPCRSRRRHGPACSTTADENASSACSAEDGLR